MNCAQPKCSKKAVVFLQVTSKIPGRTFNKIHGEMYCTKHGKFYTNPAAALEIINISKEEYETLKVVAE